MTQTTTGISIITHIVTNINREQTPEEMLAATGRKQYTDSCVVASMPRGTGDSQEILFIKLGRYISAADLEEAEELGGTIPCDPYTLGKHNEDNPEFGDSHPNGTHWKDEGGKPCFAAFDRWHGKRRVHVDQRDFEWSVIWWLARLRKPV